MTPDEMIEHGDLIRKYGESVKNGKPITVQYEAADRKWYDYEVPYGNTPDFDIHYRWREKPREPRTWWARKYHRSNVVFAVDFYNSKEQAVGEAKVFGGEVIRMMEVFGDE